MTQQNGSRAVAAMMESIINKEGDYYSAIKENHQRSTMAADRLARHGVLEQVLLKLAREDKPIVSEDDVQTFLTEQRARLLNMAGRNVENSQTVQRFVAAAKTIREQELSNTQVQPEGDEEFVNYDVVFRGAMEKHEADRASSQLPLEQEKYYRDIAERLGEPTVNAKGKKKKGNNNEEDDDIMVVNNGQGQAFTLKCPITMQLMDDPVINKMCKHHYSKAAIANYISTKRKNRGPNYKVGCPVPGCFNQNVNMNQLEDDSTILLQVRRFKKQEERETQMRSSQAENVDESEEEEKF
ncbi:E3 SUMO-protein ligase NSE2 [Mayamaea pseudoterrestris]|nr:E3 SUMO-protein ligase NSE2 [Mayamaea pseudoterrestris]